MMPLLLPLGAAAATWLGAHRSRASPALASVSRGTARELARRARATGARKGRRIAERRARKQVSSAQARVKRVKRAARRLASAIRKQRAGDPIAEILRMPKPTRKGQSTKRRGSWAKAADRLAKRRKAKAAPPKRRKIRMGKSTLQLTPEQAAQWRAEAAREMAAAAKRPSQRKPTPTAAPAGRSAEQAARDLYRYVTILETRPRRWGDRKNRNPTIKAAQEDMGLVADGIYGPGTRQRGKELLGKTFPARR